MNPHDLLSLVPWLAREVGRLHAENASMKMVLEELRIIDPRLDGIDVDAARKQAWQQYYGALEELNPELAAILDKRPPEAFE